MAIWQFDCDIVPAEIKNCAEQPWRSYDPPRSSVDFLPLAISRPGLLRQYGDTDSTCILMLYDGETLTDIRCRLDLRKLLKRDLSALIDYTKKIRGAFCIDNKLYAPEMDTLVDLMKASEANRFCKDPETYLKTITAKQKQ